MCIVCLAEKQVYPGVHGALLWVCSVCGGEAGVPRCVQYAAVAGCAVCLAEKQVYEVQRQERQLELSERRHQYQWSSVASTCPGRTAAATSDIALPRLIQVSPVCIVLWAYYNCDTSTIPVRFEHDSATTRYEMRTIRVRIDLVCERTKNLVACCSVL